MRDATAKLLSAVHRIAFRATDGRVGRRLVDNDMLLLTTRGRHSGRTHTVPLLYLTDDDSPPAWYVIASWGGRPYQPEWYLNLVDDPDVEIQVDGTRHLVRAEPLLEPERGEWWERAVEAYGGYDTYQSRTDRVIPVIRLRVV